MKTENLKRLLQAVSFIFVSCMVSCCHLNYSRESTSSPLIIKVKTGDNISITIPFDMAGINNPVASNEEKGWSCDDYLGCSYNFLRYDNISKEWICVEKDCLDILSISGDPPPVLTFPCATVGRIRAMIPLIESDLTYEDFMITILVYKKGLYKIEAKVGIKDIEANINYSEYSFCTFILAE